MMRPLSSRLVAVVVLAAAALGATSAAQARPDVQVSIGLPGLPLLLPPPILVRSEPVYVHPRPVYAPAPVVEYERPWRPSYRHEAERERAWRHAEWQRREWERRAWERRAWEHRHRDHRQHDRHPSQGRGRGHD